MTLKLVMPFLERSVEWARIDKWHKREGDAIGYGEEICDLVVEEVVRHAQEPSRGPLLERASGRVLAYRGTAVEFRITLVASDAGQLRRICAAEGERRALGELLALVTTTKEERPASREADIVGAPPFRVVANLIEPDTDPAAARPAGR